MKKGTDIIKKKTGKKMDNNICNSNDHDWFQLWFRDYRHWFGWKWMSLRLSSLDSSAIWVLNWNGRWIHWIFIHLGNGFFKRLINYVHNQITGENWSGQNCLEWFTYIKANVSPDTVNNNYNSRMNIICSLYSISVAFFFLWWSYFE